MNNERVFEDYKKDTLTSAGLTVEDMMEEGYFNGGGGRLLIVWGEARWTRSQLLGEIARGPWGLCTVSCLFLSPFSQ